MHDLGKAAGDEVGGREVLTGEKRGGRSMTQRIIEMISSQGMDGVSRGGGSRIKLRKRGINQAINYGSPRSVSLYLARVQWSWEERSISL